jgi:hypothetical protein
VVNWLKQFTQTSLRGLMCRNRELRYEQIQKLALRRLTIDLDGTVIRTEGRVGDARLQPPSPQGSQLLPAAGPSGSDRADPAAQYRPGNVHDSKGAERFVRELTGEIRTRLGCALTLEFRMDAAFFQQHLLKLLNRLGCFYAVKVPWSRWTGVKP